MGKDESEKITNELIFALDIGTRSVVGLVCRMQDEKLEVLDHEQVEYRHRAMNDGQIENIDLVAQSITTVKTILEERLDVNLHEVAIAAAGRALQTKKITIERKLNQSEIITNEIVRHMELEAIEQAQAAVLQENSDYRNFYCVGHIVTGYVLDGYEMSVVVGHYGSVCLMTMIAAFLPKSVVESLYSAVEKSGLEVHSLTLEPIAAMNIVIPQEVRMLNLALVDIGAGTSDIAISKAGEVIAYDMVTTAGDEITEAIMKQYLTDFATAEQIKRQLGNKKSITFVDILGFKQTLNRADVLNTLEPVVEQLVNVVTQKILQLNETAPTALFLVGGGSLYPDLAQVFGAKLNMETKRIAVGGGSRLTQILTDADAFASPLYITPLGIALTAFMEHQYQFTAVTVNGKKVRQFRYEGLKVSDVLILSGHYKYEQLVGHMGKRLRYELDGRVQNISGGLAKPAEINLNGQPASMESSVRPGDAITIIPAENGADAARTVGEVVDDLKQFDVYFDGQPYRAGKWILQNSQIAEPENTIKEGDQLKSIEALTLGQFLVQMGLTLDTLCLINGEPAMPETLLKENDHIRQLSVKPPIKPTVQEPSPLEETAEKKPKIKILLNGQPLVLPPKENNEPYMLFDLFNFVDSEQLASQNHMLICKVNDHEEPFTYILQDSDQVYIG